MKAWYVESTSIDSAWSDERGEYQTIVHADTRNKARSLAVGFGAIEAYIETRAYRRPKLDSVPLTDWNLFAIDNWVFECPECGCKINQDGYKYDDNDNEVILDPVPDTAGNVLCSPECLFEWNQKHDHSCAIGYRSVIELSTAMQARIVYPMREQDTRDWEKIWSLVYINESMYWQARIPAAAVESEDTA